MTARGCRARRRLERRALPSRGFFFSLAPSSRLLPSSSSSSSSGCRICLLMDSSLYSLDFPPLSASADGVSPPPPRNWKNIVVWRTLQLVTDLFHSTPLSRRISLSREKLSKGAQDWNLCLVGYSIGRRLSYKALLGAIQKLWNLKDFVHQEARLKDGEGDPVERKECRYAHCFISRKPGGNREITGTGEKCGCLKFSKAKNYSSSCKM